MDFFPPLFIPIMEPTITEYFSDSKDHLLESIVDAVYIFQSNDCIKNHSTDKDSTDKDKDSTYKDSKDKDKDIKDSTDIKDKDIKDKDIKDKDSKDSQNIEWLKTMPLHTRTFLCNKTCNSNSVDYFDIFEHASKFGRILVIENDTFFSDKIRQPKRLDSIRTFLDAQEKLEPAFMYSIGCLPVIALPMYDHWAGTVLGTNACIYTSAYRAELLSQKQELKTWNWDVINPTCYFYSEPLCFTVDNTVIYYWLYFFAKGPWILLLALFIYILYKMYEIMNHMYEIMNHMYEIMNHMCIIVLHGLCMQQHDLLLEDALWRL